MIRQTFYNSVFFATLFSTIALLPDVESTAVRGQEPDTDLIDIGPVGEMEQVASELQFTEGPTPDDQGGLYFTDIPANRIYRWTIDNGLEVFLEPSGHANGLLWTKKHGLLACQMDGQVVAIDTTDKSIKVLAKEFEGKRFNAPNDLVIDSTGGIYFTDPLYRAPMPLPQGTMAVYYIAADGEVQRVVESLPAPNGIVMSPDESTLYVIPSQEKRMWRFPIDSPGQLGEGSLFCELQQAPGTPEPGSGGDGGTVDTSGNIYITTGLGVQVFSPKGDHLGTIEIPEHPANVTFGGDDLQTLFVTARTGLYKAAMKAKGHRFTGGK